MVIAVVDAHHAGNASGVSEDDDAVLLSKRRWMHLPVEGDGSPVTLTQGRGPSEATSPEGLAGLVSSIASIGVLQPILVEELTDGTRLIIHGERRFRAFRMAKTAAPDRPHLRKGIPATVCPGPLSEVQRRRWQMIENIERWDLAPGEAAAQLMLERAALLVARLAEAGIEVPADIAEQPDPMTRWAKLDAFRVKNEAHNVGAPWPDVLASLRMNLSEASARKLVRAFSAMPAGLAGEMDEAGVRLHARVEWLRLYNSGRKEAALGLWEAVKALQKPELLTPAASAAYHDDIDAAEAIRRAEAANEETNANRARLVAERWAGSSSDEDDASPDNDSFGSGMGGPAEVTTTSRHGSSADPAAVPGSRFDTLPCDDVINALRDVLEALRKGRRPGKFDTNSLRLLCGEVLTIIDPGEIASVADEAAAS